MSKLSPYVRSAIDSGTSLFAKVEEVHLGQATVRLGSDGQGTRMTNLSMMDDTIEAGDEVIVDYAAGIEPVVRPLTTVVEEVDDIVLATEFAKETLKAAGDIGCRVNNHCFDHQWDETGVPKFPLYENIPVKIPFNEVYWDSGGMYYPGSTQVTIKTAGYYLVTFCLIEPVNPTHIWTFQGWQLHVTEMKGCFHGRVLCNGTPILDVYGRNNEDNDYNVSELEGTVFDHFDVGDKLELELTIVGFEIEHPSVTHNYDICYGSEGILSSEGEKSHHTLTAQCVVIG